MTKPGQNVQLTRLSDVKPERVEWIWRGWIPAGKLVTLDGDPGLGKSTLSDDFSARVTTAGMWPDGSRCERPGDVLLLSAEDGLADTVRPRLDAAGADVTRVHAIEGIPVVDDSGERFLRPPSLGDIVALEEAITETSARLLIVDVLMAYLPSGADAHKDQDVRRVLNRLSALADKTGCTVLLLRHLNKAKGGDPLYRGGGSIGIVGAARAGMLVAADPDEPDLRVLASVKSNLGPAPESLSYRLVGEGDFGVARVQWEGQNNHTARSLLSEHADDGDDAAVESWLSDFLKTGRRRATEIYSAADAAGHSKDKAKRAKKRLQIDAIRENDAWYWVLRPGQGSSAPAARLNPAPLLPCSLAGQGGKNTPENTQGSKGAEDGWEAATCSNCPKELTSSESIAVGLCRECALVVQNTPSPRSQPTEVA
ncbi:AAA family ATPase [Mycobacterium sp. SA01]|uniref:AAA family ATPase n=1 Tax=Mycobacterium sp. SA01 TaxID=3238820 RepID=UPI00351BC204